MSLGLSAQVQAETTGNRRITLGQTVRRAGMRAVLAIFALLTFAPAAPAAAQQPFDHAASAPSAAYVPSCGSLAARSSSVRRPERPAAAPTT